MGVHFAFTIDGFNNPFKHKCKFKPVGTMNKFMKEKYSLFSIRDEGMYTVVLKRCTCGEVQVQELKGKWTAKQLGIDNEIEISDEDLKKLIGEDK